MNSNIAPDVTPFVVAFIIIDAIAVLTLVGLGATALFGFVRRHRGSRRTAKGFVPAHRGELTFGQ